MKFSMFASTFFLLAISSHASSPYIAGKNDYWTRNSAVTTSVHGDGTLSIDFIGTKKLQDLGYSQTIKSALKDEWKFENGDYSGKIYVNRRGPKRFESVTIQNKNSDGKDWVDISIFGEENVLLRRTTCRDRKCFVVKKSMCDKLAMTAGMDIGSLKDLQKQCNTLSTLFKNTMKEEYKSSTMETDFRADLDKVSNPTHKRNIVMGEDIDASTQNLYSYLSQCEDMKEYNKANVISTGGVTPGTRTR